MPLEKPPERRVRVSPRTKVEQVVELAHAAVDGRRVHAIQAAEVGQDLAPVQAVVQAHPTIDDADGRPNRFAVLDDVVARDGRAPGVRREEGREDAQRGGLAGAVRTEQPEHLATADLETQVLHRMHAVERLVDVPHRDHSRLPRWQAASRARRRHPGWVNVTPSHRLDGNATVARPTCTFGFGPGVRPRRRARPLLSSRR